MANISTAITKIRTAVMGQDVRAGIADAMEAVNTDNIEILNTLENVDLPTVQAAAITAQNAAATATQKAIQATEQSDRAAGAANLAITAESNVSQYIETMSEQAVAATTAATTATQKATQAATAAETAVNNAHQTETFAGDALASAAAAATAAGQISEAAGQATAKAAEALQSANTSATKATEATTAANTVLAALENLPEGNVTPEEKAAWNAKQNALGFTPENVASKGLANGYAALDASGKVPVSQLPENGTGGSSGVLNEVTNFVVTAGLAGSALRPVLKFSWVTPAGSVDTELFISSSNIINATYDHCLANTTKIEKDSLTTGYFDKIDLNTTAYIKAFTRLSNGDRSAGVGATFNLTAETLLSPVTSFAGVMSPDGDKYKIVLTWENPNDWDFKNVEIRYKGGLPGSPPQNPDDWGVLYEGTAETAILTNISNPAVPYSFRITAHAVGGNWNSEQNKSLIVVTNQ